MFTIARDSIFVTDHDFINCQSSIHCRDQFVKYCDGEVVIRKFNFFVGLHQNLHLIADGRQAQLDSAFVLLT